MANKDMSVAMPERIPMDIGNQEEDEYTDYPPEFHHWGGAAEPYAMDEEVCVSPECFFGWEEPYYQKLPRCRRRGKRALLSGLTETGPPMGSGRTCGERKRRQGIGTG